MSARTMRVVGAAFLFLLILAPVASAQNARLKSIKHCNGADQSSSEAQIKGCTTLIESGNEPSRVLAIAFNNRGNVYVAMGDLPRAIRDYDQAIKQAHNYAKAFNNRGVAFGKGGQHDRAIRDFDTAIGLDPKYANAYANRAESFLDIRELARAVNDYDAAIRLQPTAAALNGRCRTRVIMGELQSAIADCSEALRLEEHSAVTLDLLGLAYLRFGQWDLAISSYNSALSIDPSRASSLYGRGIAYVKKGLVDQSDVDIAAAKSIAPHILEEFVRFGLDQSSAGE